MLGLLILCNTYVSPFDDIAVTAMILHMYNRLSCIQVDTEVLWHKMGAVIVLILQDDCVVLKKQGLGRGLADGAVINLVNLSSLIK